MKKYKTNKPHEGDYLMVVLRNDNVDLSASNRHKLTTSDAVYFFCACVEPLGSEPPTVPDGLRSSILEYYSNESGDHGCVEVIHQRSGDFDFAYPNAKYGYGYCKIYPAVWAHDHEYPVKLRIPPPTYYIPAAVKRLRARNSKKLRR